MPFHSHPPPRRGAFDWVEQDGGKMKCPSCGRVFQGYADDLIVRVRIKPLAQITRGCTDHTHHKCGAQLEIHQQRKPQVA
jgi:hypothetical protein